MTEKFNSTAREAEMMELVKLLAEVAAKDYLTQQGKALESSNVHTL